MTEPSNKIETLTKEDVEAACDTFFPLFEIVASRCPEGTTVGEALKISRAVFMLAQKQRMEGPDRNDDFVFGFNRVNRKS